MKQKAVCVFHALVGERPPPPPPLVEKKIAHGRFIQKCKSLSHSLMLCGRHDVYMEKRRGFFPLRNEREEQQEVVYNTDPRKETIMVQEGHKFQIFL